MPVRKPIRGGATAPKQSLAQRAARTAPAAVPATAQPSMAKARSEAQRDAPRIKTGDARLAGTPPAKRGERGEHNERGKETPQRRGERPAPPPKAYPKRGIARSTGVRALPPSRDSDAHSMPAPQALPAAPSRPLHTAAPRAPADSARRPLKEPPRLSKRLCEMTSCSRREADEWIENGWVSVDGVVVTTLGARVHPSAKIDIKDAASQHQSESVTIVLNLPADGGPAESPGEAVQLIRAANRWAEDESPVTFKATHLRGLAQVGKLDAGVGGMLVFTQEGSVARRINGDDTRLEKEYMVRVEGELSPENLKLLNFGLALDEVKLKRAQVSWQNEKQLRFVLHEARKQQIQRMCELVGLRATAIKRIRIGSVSLGKLPAGQWRYLRADERF